MKNLIFLFLTIPLAIVSQAQPTQSESFKKMDKLFQPYLYGKHKIVLEPSRKNFIPIDHFKEYFIDKIGKLSYSDFISGEIDVFGKIYPCVKQFTLTKFAPDPCEENPFSVTSIEPLVLFYNEIFPSFICGVTSNVPPSANDYEKFFSDKSGSIGFKFSSRCPQKKINYEINSLEGYFKRPLKGEFYTSAGNVEIFPDIPWDYDKLLCTQGRTPGTLTFKFYDEKGEEVNKTTSVHYRSPNDCILSVNLKNLGYASSELTRMYWGTIAYVNEESANVNILMNDVVKTHPEIKAWGAAAGQGNDLLVQIKAVWEFIQTKNVLYSSIPGTPDKGNPNLMTQNLRNIESSLDQGLANCIDGTVLFASILRRWGFETYLVLVPGHAYLAFDIPDYDLDQNKEVTNRYHLETTKIGETDEKTGQKRTFEYALLYGKFETDKVFKEEVEYLSLNKYRSFIKPIPFRSCAEFRK